MQWFFLERYVHCNLGISHLKEGAETCFSAVEHIHFTRPVNLKSSFSAFYRPFRLIAATTTCLHSSPSFAVSSAFLTTNIFKSSFFLSVYLFLGLLVFGFQAVICPISPFDLHTCLAQPINKLFKVPTMLSSLYSFSKFLLLRIISYFPSLFLSGPNIFLSNTSNFFSSAFVVTQVLLVYRATGLTRTL